MSIDKAKAALEYAHSFPVRDAKDMALLAIANALVAIAEQGVESTLECIEDKSRWAQMFGTPERAARTLVNLNCDGSGCDGCSLGDIECNYGEDALLEWLRGDA